MPTNTALANRADPIEFAPMLTGSQIRAARALLKWSAQELSDRSGISYAAIQRAEKFDDLPNMHVKSLAAVKAALEKAGCLFFDGPYSGDGGPGVRLK